MKERSVEKHPRAIRWFHWIHFPLIALMVWSGILIYWANDVYIEIPDALAHALRINNRLAEGMAWHFFLMWLFAANGVAYFFYLAVSGEWRVLVPGRGSIADAWRVLLHDLRLRKEAPAQGKYNAAQRIAYTSVILMGAGSLLTGLAIYKPVQASFLTSALGGYDVARLEHFVLMFAFIAFFVVHIAQVARAGWPNLRGMITGHESGQGRLAGSLFVGSFVALTAASVFFAIQNGPTRDEAPALLRRVFEWNGKLGAAVQSDSRLSPYKKAPPPGSEPRFNGSLGLESALDLTSYRVRVESGDTRMDLSMSDIRLLPKQNTSTEFKCIEGWRDIFSYSGVRFSDFVRIYHLGQKPDGSFYRYVGLETPDRQYYVSIDIDSMMHPQTFLVYEMNESPMTLENGAPLRLIIPIKYGIKSLKRIGRIFFSDTRPPDYWAERGYDWFSGL